jgi:hypothetical protein
MGHSTQRAERVHLNSLLAQQGCVCLQERIRHCERQLILQAPLMAPGRTDNTVSWLAICVGIQQELGKETDNDSDTEAAL